MKVLNGAALKRAEHALAHLVSAGPVSIPQAAEARLAALLATAA